MRLGVPTLTSTGEARCNNGGGGRRFDHVTECYKDEDGRSAGIEIMRKAGVHDGHVGGCFTS